MNNNWVLISSLYLSIATPGIAVSQTVSPTAAGDWQRVDALKPGTRIVVTLKTGEKRSSEFRRATADAVTIADREAYGDSVKEETLSKSVIETHSDSACRPPPPVGLNAFGAYRHLAIPGPALAGQNLVRYHGVLAANAKDRAAMVPGGAPPTPSGSKDAGVLSPQPLPPLPRKNGRYLEWAALMLRVFEIQLLRYPCGGRFRLVAMVMDAEPGPSVTCGERASPRPSHSPGHPRPSCWSPTPWRDPTSPRETDNRSTPLQTPEPRGGGSCAQRQPAHDLGAKSPALWYFGETPERPIMLTTYALVPSMNQTSC